MLGHLGAMLGHLGATLGHLGSMLCHLGARLGLSWAILGLILGHLGAMLGLCWVKGYPPEVVMLDLTCFFRRAKNAKNTVNYGGGRGACGRRGPPGT